jgi:hypothetical protein
MKFDEKMGTTIRLLEKSFKLLGNNHSQANGKQASITTNSAGKIRLALLS